MRKRWNLFGAAAVVAAGLLVSSCSSTSGDKPTVTQTRTPSVTPTITPVPATATRTFTFTNTHTFTNTPFPFQPTPTIAQYLYIYGGDDDTANSVSAAYSAQILGAGALGSWTSTMALPIALTNIGYTFTNGYAYAIGGREISTSTDNTTAYYASMSGGTLGAWAQSSPIPVAGLELMGAGVSTGQLWVWDSDPTANYASTLSGGVPTTWNTASAAATVVVGAAWGSDGSYLYTAGGLPGANVSGATRSAQTFAGGTTSAWTAQPPLPTPVAFCGWSHEAGIFIVVGGTQTANWSSGPRSSVYVAQTQNGLISAWTTAPSLPVAVFQPAVIRTGGYVYVVGGFQTISGTTGNAVFRSSITGTTLSTWTSLATIPIHVEAHGITAW